VAHNSAHEEIWLPMVGYVDWYDISNQGRIRSRRTGRILSPKPTSWSGYIQVNLTDAHGVHRKWMAHRLVALTFLGDPPDESMDVCHNDGNRTNNHVGNLRWDTRSGNLLDKRIHGTDQFGGRTHCSKGHEYTPENTRVYRRNHWRLRICRTCRRLQVQARKKRESACQ
jgi:hypothetical protein